MSDDINQQPWESWWLELQALARANGNQPGQPEMWKRDNWARNQTPQEAYRHEYVEQGPWH